MPNVMWLERLEDKDASICGIKAMRISDLLRAGIRTQPGFVITHDALEKFLVDNNLMASVMDMCEEFESVGLDEIKYFHNNYSKKVSAAEMPWDLEVEILNALKQAGFSYPLVLRPSFYVDITSSATLDEESGRTQEGEIVYRGIDPEALGSKVIGMKSYLNIVSEDMLKKKILSLWQNFYNYEMLKWMKENNANPSRLRMGIVVQSLVACTSYGSMISMMPGGDNTVYLQIRARSGFCSESLYDPTPDLEAYQPGRNIPWDIYTIDRASMSIKDKKITMQAMEFFPKPTGGLGQQPVPYERGSKQKLSDEEIMALVEMGIEIEKRFSVPVYIQWGIKNSQPYIFEYRKMTAMQREMEKDQRKDEVIETSAQDIGEREVPVESREEILQEMPVIETEDEGNVQEMEVVEAPPFADRGPAEEMTAEQPREQVAPSEEHPHETVDFKGEIPFRTATVSGEVSLMLYSDIRSAPEDIVGDGVVVWLDYLIWSELKKHPLHWSQNSARKEFVSFMNETIGRIARSVYPRNVIVVLSHFSPAEYSSFQEAQAYEDMENSDTHYRGILRALHDEEFMNLYTLEVSTLVDMIGKGLDNIAIAIPGMESIGNMDEGIARIYDIFENSEEYIEDPGLYMMMLVDSPGTLMTAEASLQDAFIGGYLMDYCGIQNRIHDIPTEGRRQHFSESVSEFVLKKMCRAAEEYEFDVVFAIDRILRARHMVERLVDIGVHAVSVSPSEIDYLARLVSAAERKLMMRER